MTPIRQPQGPEGKQPLDESKIVVRTLGVKLPPGLRIEEHAHDWHQLVYGTEGVMTVRTATGSWVVPPSRAVWIPARSRHAVLMTGTVRMRTIYLRPGFAQVPFPTDCSVVQVSPLLRELILETMRARFLFEDIPEQARLAAVLADQIVTTPDLPPLHIVLPRDGRALEVAKRARAELSETAPLEVLCEGTGASVRTIERLFRQETGLPFGRWLQQVKALHALELLASGESVTHAGLAVGYDSTSAFIAMFRRVLGTTPGSYFPKTSG
ncbi:MAG: helix-turn-helix transcriptional regulator [Planctomycetota bacterium]